MVVGCWGAVSCVYGLFPQISWGLGAGWRSLDVHAEVQMKASEAKKSGRHFFSAGDGRTEKGQKPPTPGHPLSAGTLPALLQGFQDTHGRLNLAVSAPGDQGV